MRGKNILPLLSKKRAIKIDDCDESVGNIARGRRELTKKGHG